jgi:hypothetical protein
MIRGFIDKANPRTKNEIEELVAGNGIKKSISTELTYNELDKSIENLRSVLFETGYLTGRKTGDKEYELVISNNEIRSLFINQIQE